MQLRNARLCLDCEEVHDDQQCPACASETFAFITRWVPAPERRARPRPAEPSRPEELEAYQMILQPERSSAGWKLVRRSAVGLAVFGMAGWMWGRQGSRPRTESAEPTRDAAEPTGPAAALSKQDGGREPGA